MPSGREFAGGGARRVQERRAAIRLLRAPGDEATPPAGAGELGGYGQRAGSRSIVRRTTRAADQFVMAEPGRAVVQALVEAIET